MNKFLATSKLLNSIYKIPTGNVPRVICGPGDFTADYSAVRLNSTFAVLRFVQRTGQSGEQDASDQTDHKFVHFEHTTTRKTKNFSQTVDFA